MTVLGHAKLPLGPNTHILVEIIYILLMELICTHSFLASSLAQVEAGVIKAKQQAFECFHQRVVERVSCEVEEG